MDSVRMSLLRLEDLPRTLLSEIDSTTMKIRLLAEDVERQERSDMVEQLGVATLEMVKTADLIKYHLQAMQHLAATYEPSAEPTDFEGLLESKRKELEAASPCDPENSRFYKQFKEAVWNVHHAGELMPGQETEDIVMTTSEYGIKNTTCPVTGKPVTELENPVRSMECQHIYEKFAVTKLIQQKGRRPCPCAIAGCPKVLVLEKLVCDEYLKLEIEELKAKGLAAQEGMEDFTDLEAIPDSIDLGVDSDDDV